MKSTEESSTHRLMEKRRRIVKRSVKVKPQIINFSSSHSQLLMDLIKSGKLVPATYNENTE